MFSQHLQRRRDPIAGWERCGTKKHFASTFRRKRYFRTLGEQSKNGITSISCQRNVFGGSATLEKRSGVFYVAFSFGIWGEGDGLREKAISNTLCHFL